jgi:hypothetical protein
VNSGVRGVLRIARAVVGGALVATGVLGGFGAGGCATVPAAGPAHLAPATTTTTWEAARDEATRRVEVYDVLDRQADLRATLLTPRVRKAFLDERARFHGAFAAAAQRDWVAMGTADEGVDATPQKGPQGEDEVLVFVAFYASDPKTRSLATRTSIWDVALVHDSLRVRPSRIEELSVSPAVVEVFPYVDRFDDVYLLHFPLVDAATGATPLRAGELALEVTSARAACVVRWALVD